MLALEDIILLDEVICMKLSRACERVYGGGELRVLSAGCSLTERTDFYDFHEDDVRISILTLIMTGYQDIP